MSCTAMGTTPRNAARALSAEAGEIVVRARRIAFKLANNVPATSPNR